MIITFASRPAVATTTTFTGCC